jgi:hypothetical protein
VARKETDTDALTAVGQALTALAPRADAQAPQRLADQLIAAAAWSRVAVVAALLDSPTAIRASDAMATAVGGTVDANLANAAGQGWAVLAPRLDGPAAQRAWGCLAGTLDKAGNILMYGDASRGLAALAARLDGPAVVRAFDTIIALVERGGAVGDPEAVGTAAVALIDRMDAANRPISRARLARAAATGLKQVRNRVRLQGSWADVCFVIDQFAPLVERAIAVGDLRLSGIGRGYEGDVFDAPQFVIGWPLFAATADLATIADCLRHPACVGRTRQLVLHRLEELALPPADADKQQALAESVVTGLTQPMAGGLLAVGQQAKRERDRKFRTTWDAVVWLTEHHPEIDLDKPYTPRK